MFRKHIILFLSLSITISSLSGFSSLANSVYAQESSLPVSYEEDGFYFSVGNRTVRVRNEQKLVEISEDGVTREYYFSEPFTLEEGNLVLTKDQANLLLNSTEGSNARRVRVGTVIDRINERNTVRVYSDESLTQSLGEVSVSSDIKVINSVLDGKLRVLTEYGEGFIDSRYVRILEDTLPPNLVDFKVDSPYVITVNQQNRTLKVFERNESGLYDVVEESLVTTGRVEEPTPNGIFTTTGHRGEWFDSGDVGAGAKYFLQFRGNYLFHSVLFSSRDKVNEGALSQLGQKGSDGCIRVPVETAKWIYETIPKDTLVIIDNKDTDVNAVSQNNNI